MRTARCLRRSGFAAMDPREPYPIESWLRISLLRDLVLGEFLINPGEFADIDSQTIDPEFRLASLITEQPHSKTSQFSTRAQRDTRDGVLNLLEVDRDMPPVLERVFAGVEYARLVHEMIRCITGGHTVCFSGCGASGRVAIILESIWRTFWKTQASQLPAHKAECLTIANQVVSIMTGGDRALIRSVEYFEDYQVFGRRQVSDAGLNKSDLLIAMSEDGVVSSVIGTARQALDIGCQIVLIFNNPRATLCENYQRSREVILDERVVTMDLTTGAMALTGSTRLQATSMAMILIGAAMEEAFCAAIARHSPGLARELHPAGIETLRQTCAQNVSDLIDQLSTGATLDGLARFIDLEADVYFEGGRVTYVAEQYLLDIFSDTTERTPTFMLPPFRSVDRPDAPASWAFAKYPLLPTPEAWAHVLKRLPRGISWTVEDYRAMAAQPEIIQNPPVIDNAEILKYQIGNENDPSRYTCPASSLIWVSFDEVRASEFVEAYTSASRSYTRPAIVTLGSEAWSLPGCESIHIPLDLGPTCCKLMRHVAVKLIFNVLSTTTMGKMGRILGNWMIQVDAINKKLVDRATRIIVHFSGLPYEKAWKELHQTISQPSVHRLQFKESYVVQTLRRLNVNLAHLGL